MRFRRSTFLYMILITLLSASLAACGGTPPATGPVGSAPTTPATPQPTEEPTVEQPTMVPTPVEEPTPAEEPTVEPAPTEEPTVEPTPTEEPTTEPAETTEPVGASGERVLYIRFDYGRQAAELRSVGVDGSDDRVIFACEAPCDIAGVAVSPSRDEIAFNSHGMGATQSLVIASSDGTELRRLQGSTFISAQAWSPDGERLAYVQSRATGDSSPVEQSAVFVMDRNGETTQLTEWAFFTEAPQWLDDDHVLFSRATGGTPPTGWNTYQVDASGSMEEQLVAEGELVQVSSDRTHLLVMVETMPDDASQRVLTLVPVNGGEPQPIAENVDRFGVAWAPNGEYFVFFDPAARAITRIEASDGSRTELRALDQATSIPFARMAWSPDGADLYYTHTQTATDQTEIHRLQIDSDEDQVIASYQGDPRPLVVTR